ncbi:MAG: hypothetical protein MJA27_10975 [Pseudanabaenales cyanobacterium]|nr:hypothetical protein [Pseudanabaenales cyanobacterium]
MGIPKHREFFWKHPVLSFYCPGSGTSGIWLFPVASLGQSRYRGFRLLKTPYRIGIMTHLGARMSQVDRAPGSEGEKGSFLSSDRASANLPRLHGRMPIGLIAPVFQAGA